MTDRPPSDPLRAERVLDALETRHIGRPLVVRDEVASTMAAMAELAREGTPDGTVVLTDYQRAGRGRHDRRWEAPPGTSLMLSILVRPELPPERVPHVQMAVALGACDALRPYLPAVDSARLKWPNDILVHGDKIGGLLSEVVWPTGDGPPQVVVGLGLNVRQRTDALPAGATSLALCTRAERLPSRARLAAELLNDVDRWYGKLLAGESLVERWAGRLDTLGHEVTAETADGVVRGRAVGVTPDGALRVRVDDGEVVELRAAEVRRSRRRSLS